MRLTWLLFVLLFVALFPVLSRAAGTCTKGPVVCDTNYLSGGSVRISGANPAAACSAQYVTVTVNTVSTRITYGTGWCASGGDTCISNKSNACKSLALQIRNVAGVASSACSTTTSTVTVVPTASVNYFQLATSAAACAAVSNPSTGGQVQIGQTILKEGGDGALTAYKLDGSTKATLAAGTLALSGNLTVGGSTTNAGIWTGTNSETMDNETNNVIKFAQSGAGGEDLKLTVGTDLWTWSSTTSATMAITPALAIAGDLTLSGGANALIFGSASSSIIVPNNSATALIVGSSGLTNLLTLDTSTGAQNLKLTGTTSATALHVDVGNAIFDENVVVSGTLSVAALAGTGATGLGLVAANSANQACNTTCGAGTCLVGINQTGPVFVACDDATADTCACLP